LFYWFFLSVSRNRKLHLQPFNSTSDFVLWSEIQSALFKRLSFLISSLNSATTLLFNPFRGLFSKWTPELQHYYLFNRCSDWFVRATSSSLFNRFSDWFVPQIELLHSCSIGYSDRFVLQIQLHLSCWIGFLIDLFCKLSYIILVPLVFWSICSVSRATSFLFNRFSESFVLQIEIHHSCESHLLCKWSYIILVQSAFWEICSPLLEVHHSCSIGFLIDAFCKWATSFLFNQFSDRFVLQIQLHHSCLISFLIPLCSKFSYIILVPLVFW
jgi:hypothetical protein